MDNILQLLIKSNTVNFLIVLALIIFLYVKLNISKKTDMIRDEIKDYVEASEQEKCNAEQELTEIKNKIKNLPEEIEDIEKSADNSVRNLGIKIRNEIEEQKKDIANNAERLFNFETKKFKSKLTKLLSEKSVEIAKENALRQLNEDKTLHSKYIDDAINELDRITL